MDEDLKIVLTSELEADEQASAQRISAQLPAIAKLINSKSSIKVGVSLDDVNVQAQTQKIASQLQAVSSKTKLNMKFDFGADKVEELKRALATLKFPQDTIKTFIDNINAANTGVRSISTSFDDVRNVVTATISGLDRAGNLISQIQSARLDDDGSATITKNLTAVVTNYEQLAKAEERAEKAQEQAAERRQTEAANLASSLDNVRAKYEGLTSATRQVTNQESLNSLKSKYDDIDSRIQTMKNSSDAYSTAEVANIRKLIAELDREAQGYSNAEKAATALRKKSVEEIKLDESGSLDVLEERLKSAGILTEQFQNRIRALRTELGNVTDRNGITDYFGSLSSFSNDVALMETRLQSLNSIYTDMIANEREQVAIQKQLISDTGMSDTTRANLESQLLVLKSQHAVLESQRASYVDIDQYSSQRAKYEQANYNNMVGVANAEADVAAKAQEADKAMKRMPTSIADLEARFRQVINPTETLKANMQSLREAMETYGNAGTDQEKIRAYKRIKDLVGQCKTEMIELARVSNSDLKDFKFDENLKKAQADLETIGRTWSAFKYDDGLSAQFRQLRIDLKAVDNEMDLKKWTAQFSAFKSEVKASGKNMLSFADSVKNAASKITQWALGTMSIYGVINKLKSAISTVVDLDTAMIDLQKVTSETDAQYQAFYETANDTAKALGVTTEAIISQTAEWARLGFSMQDAAAMAETSALFAAISPGMDTEEATDGLISVMKAYKYNADEMTDVISEINIVGNNFAVSNQDVVNALTRSSSAMAAANNSFEETVALITAGTEITRDAESMGNALKTVSMRIRNLDEETEEYSEDIAELTGGIIELTKTKSTPKGVSLFTDDTLQTYRSTYEILQDISKIWDEISDKNRAQILYTLFGARQGQVGASILSNFAQAESAIDAMANSAGNAEAEFEKIEQSLEYKINALQETWTGVAQNLFQTDQIAFVVDGLTLLSGLIDKLTGSLGLFGTAAAIVFGVQIVKSVGRPESTGFKTVPTYAPVATRNELVA